MSMPVPTQVPAPTPSSLGPILSEWNTIVLAASHGAGGKYITAIPSTPFPGFRVGNTLDEKLEQCNKVIREMVRSARSTNNVSFSNGKLFLRVDSVSYENVRVQESLIIKTASDDPGEVKKIIKLFCDSVYSKEQTGQDLVEWGRIHHHSLQSTSIVKNVPSQVPIFFMTTGKDPTSLYNSCRKALETLFSSGSQRTSLHGQGAQPSLLLTCSGKYPQLDGSVTSYTSSLICDSSCSKQTVSDAISDFCRSIYLESPTDRVSTRRMHLQHIYERVHTATTQTDSPFGELPREFPEFLVSALDRFQLGQNGVFAQDMVLEICKEMFGAIWRISSTKTPTQRYKTRFSVSGVSSTQAVKLTVNWGGTVGQTTITFPLIDTSGPRVVSFESLSAEFCRNIFSVPPALPTPTLPTPTLPTPTLPTPTLPTPTPPAPTLPPPPAHLAPDRYAGRRPPLGFPNQIMLAPAVSPVFSSSVLSYSRGIWSKLNKHASFGIGSASITGLGKHRYSNFLTPPGEKALYEHCYNLFAEFYNTAFEYRLSADSKKLSVSKELAVDMGRDDQGVITGQHKATLIFMLPGGISGVGETRIVETLIDKFCRSFLAML